MKIRMKAAAAAVMLLVMLAAGCQETRGGVALDLIVDDPDNRKAETIRAALDGTNLNRAEMVVIRERLADRKPEVECREHPDELLLSERDETGRMCTVRVVIREPLLLGIKTEQEVLMAVPSNRERAGWSGYFPVIRHRVLEMKVLDFRQGILKGETRAEGVWSLRGER